MGASCRAAPTSEEAAARLDRRVGPGGGGPGSCRGGAAFTAGYVVLIARRRVAARPAAPLQGNRAGVAAVAVGGARDSPVVVTAAVAGGGGGGRCQPETAVRRLRRRTRGRWLLLFRCRCAARRADGAPAAFRPRRRSGAAGLRQPRRGVPGAGDRLDAPMAVGDAGAAAGGQRLRRWLLARPCLAKTHVTCGAAGERSRAVRVARVGSRCHVVGSMVGAGIFTLPAALSPDHPAWRAFVACCIAGPGVLCSLRLPDAVARPWTPASIPMRAGWRLPRLPGAFGYWIACCLAWPLLMLIKARSGSSSRRSATAPPAGDRQRERDAVGACTRWCCGVRQAAALETPSPPSPDGADPGSSCWWSSSPSAATPSCSTCGAGRAGPVDRGAPGARRDAADGVRVRRHRRRSVYSRYGDRNGDRHRHRAQFSRRAVPADAGDAALVRHPAAQAAGRAPAVDGRRDGSHRPGP